MSPVGTQALLAVVGQICQRDRESVVVQERPTSHQHDHSFPSGCASLVASATVITDRASYPTQKAMTAAGSDPEALLKRIDS